MSGSVKPPSRYHHGGLRAALLEAALDLVGEVGPRGLTLVEAARRAGVSGTAPYRHFATRDDLLAAATALAYDRLGEALRAGGQSLPDMTASYVRWSVDDAAGFALLTDGGLDPAGHPALQEAADRVFAVVLEAAGAPSLAVRAWAVAFGHACLLRTGGFAKAGMSPVDVADAARDAVRRLLG